MYFGPPVNGGWFDCFGKPVHRAHGSDSEATDILAKKHRRIYIHPNHFSSTHNELVGTGDARTFQQGVNCYRIAIGLLRRKVEVGENRELLRAIRYGYIERDAARREPILIELSDGPKVGGTEK